MTYAVQLMTIQTMYPIDNVFQFNNLPGLIVKRRLYVVLICIQSFQSRPEKCELSKLYRLMCQLQYFQKQCFSQHHPSI